MPSYDYELEDQLALQKLKEAQALRKIPIANTGDTFGKIYVPNYGAMANSVVDRISGNRMEDQATSRLRELSTAQGDEVQRLNKALMTPGVALRQGEGPLLDPTRPMNAEEENQRQMGIGMEMMQLPKARAMGTQFVNSGVGFPEKMAQQKAQQDLAREQQAARLASQQDMANQRIEAQKERDANNNALRMTLAGMAASNRSGNDDLRRELLQLQIDKAKADPKPTAAEAKVKVAEGNAVKSAGRIGDLIKEAEGNQGAFGIVPAAASMLPNVIGSRVTSKVLSEKEQVTRAKVMTEGAKAIHDIYGAALSRGEAARADSWAPNPNDDAPTILRKMKAAQEYAKTIGGVPAAPAAPAASGAYDTDKEARYQAWKAKNGK